MCIMPHIYSTSYEVCSLLPYIFYKERPEDCRQLDFCPLFIKENGQTTGLAVEITKYLLDKLDIPILLVSNIKKMLIWI